MTIHSCDLCKSTEKLLLPGDPSEKIVICASCGFVYVPERRSIAEIAAAWDHIYAFGGYDPAWPGMKARLFYVAEWIYKNIDLYGKSVLDIGAGNGQFLQYCSDHSAKVAGLDPFHKNIKKIERRGFHAILGWAHDKANCPLHDNWDIVTLNWTLENTGDCLEVLRYAKRCLRPGGHLVVATGSRILVPFKKPLGSYLPQDPDYPHDTHCFRWSVNSLTRACEAVGLVSCAQNDYEQRDELVMSFEYGEGRNEHDDPKAVQAYFDSWKTLFP